MSHFRPKLERFNEEKYELRKKKIKKKQRPSSHYNRPNMENFTEYSKHLYNSIDQWSNHRSNS